MTLHHPRRLQALVAVAALAALPEGLVRSTDQQVAFQAMLVVQLLGVIVAAIGVAAAFSAIGLALVRLASRPLMKHAATFVAWSFLTTSRGWQPWPLRLGRVLREAVDVGPELQVQWAPVRLIAGPLAVAAAALGAWQCAHRDPTVAWLVARNLVAALGLHALLWTLSGIGRAAWRSAAVLGLVWAAWLAAAVAARHPAVLPYVDPTALLGAGALIGALGLWRPGRELGMAKRLARRGQVAFPLALLLLVGALALRARWGATTPIVALLSVTIAAAVVGLYLLLQGQRKVSVPVFVSVVGVAAGTWALIVVLSVMGGFAADLRAKMLVANAHALVETPGRAKPFAHAAVLAQAVRGVPGVAAVSPQIRGDAILSSSYNVNNFVSIRGIDADLPEVERELGGTLRTGSLALLRNPASLGADRAMIRRPLDLPSDLPPSGDVTPSGGIAPTAASPKPESGDRLLDALRQLPPGPAEAKLPGPLGDRRLAQGDMLLVPSGSAPIRAKATVGEAVPEELGPAVEPAAPPDSLARPPDRPSKGGLLGLFDDPPSPAPENLDVPVPPGVLIGVELARSLQVDLGDKLEIVTPDGDVGPTGMRPRVRTFRVAGTFETGLYEADSKVAYLTLDEAARYFNFAGEANVMELRLDHPEEPDEVVAQVRKTLAQRGAAGLEVIDWRALNRSLFSALAFERLVIFLVLGLIILVAAFAIVSALTMVILQKHDSIAMLRAMGAAASEVRSAFVQMGGVIGVMGTAAGAMLGLGTCGLIEVLGIQLPEAYYVRTLPVRLQPAELGAVILASIGISLLATVFPARSAAKLQPLEGLRHG